MIAFGPPHDPDSPEGREYAVHVENIKRYRREMRERREEALAEMEKTRPLMERYAGGNPFAFMVGFIIVCSIPAILMLLLINLVD